MRFYIPLFLFAALIISGCSDNQITEITYGDRVGQTEIINEEPPELVQAYNDLWMEISHEQSRGIFDSTKVLKANRMAIELSEYDGPMAEVFKTLEVILDAHVAGKSIEEIKEQLGAMREEKSPLIVAKTFGPNLKECLRACAQNYADETQGYEETFAVTSGVCITGALIGTLFNPTIPGLVVGFGSAYGCVGMYAWLHYRNMGRAKKKRSRCKEECIRRHQESP